MAKWIYEDYDEYGRYYYCSHCGSGIVVENEFGKWTPKKCSLCDAEMEGVSYGEDD